MERAPSRCSTTFRTRICSWSVSAAADSSPASRSRWRRDAGSPVPLERVQTVADGLAAPIAGVRNLEIIRRHVADVVVVPDEVILEGVRFLASRARLVAEPAGAAAVGALLAGRVVPRPRENVVAIVSGGNVDLSRLAEFFQA